MKVYFKMAACVLMLGLGLGPGAASAQEAAMSAGEIVKVDKEASKLIIKHGPLDNLKMPAMTMAFKAKAPAMLEQVQAGDKVHFVAEKVQGVLTVTVLERQ